MAITVINNPVIYGHASDSVIEVSSNNVSQPGFKFVFDVYVSGLNFWGHPFQRYFVSPLSLVGRFNISKCLRSVATYELPVFSSSNNFVIEQGGVGRKVDVSIGEAYFTSSTTYSIIPNLVTISGWMYYLAYNRSDEKNKYTQIPNQLIDRRKIKKFFLVKHNQQWVNVIADNNVIASNLISCLATYMPSGNTIYSETIGPINNRGLFNAQLNAFDGAWGMNVVDVLKNVYVNDKQLLIIFESKDALGNSILVQQLYYDVVRCVSDDGIMLYWINKFGQLDAYYFPIWKRINSNIYQDTIIEKSQYDGFKFGDRYYSRENRSIRLTSLPIVDDEDMEGLADLFSAKYVWYSINETQPKLYRCLVQDNSVEVRKYKTDKVFQLSLTINDGYSII